MALLESEKRRALRIGLLEPEFRRLRIQCLDLLLGVVDLGFQLLDVLDVLFRDFLLDANLLVFEMRLLIQ